MLELPATSYWLLTTFLRNHVNHCKECERRAEAEVQLPQAQPVQALRPSPRLPAQVRRLPSVLPRPGAQGRNPGRRQVELVEKQFTVHSANNNCELRAKN